MTLDIPRTRAVVALEEPGEHTVRIVGRRVGSDVDEVVELDRTVTVESE